MGEHCVVQSKERLAGRPPRCPVFGRKGQGYAADKNHADTKQPRHLDAWPPAPRACRCHALISCGSVKVEETARDRFDPRALRDLEMHGAGHRLHLDIHPHSYLGLAYTGSEDF